MPGEAAKSLMIMAINHDGDLHMPEGSKLSFPEIEILTKWVDQGALWPDAPKILSKVSSSDPKEIFSEEQKRYWAFQRPLLPVIPKVKDASWSKSDIDRFVLARLEEKGLVEGGGAVPLGYDLQSRKLLPGRE